MTELALGADSGGCRSLGSCSCSVWGQGVQPVLQLLQEDAKWREKLVTCGDTEKWQLSKLLCDLSRCWMPDEVPVETIIYIVLLLNET